MFIVKTKTVYFLGIQVFDNFKGMLNHHSQYGSPCIINRGEKIKFLIALMSYQTGNCYYA